MTITAAVTMEDVVRLEDRSYDISLRLICSDTDLILPVEIINQVFRINHKTTESVASLQTKFVTAMQEVINLYKADNFVYSLPKQSQILTGVQTALVLT